MKFYLEDSDTKISVVTEKPVKKDQNPQASFTEQEEIEYPLSESKKYAERKENETINKQEQKPESKNIVQIVEDDTELESEIKNNNQALNGMDEEVLYPPIAILEPEEPVKIVVEEDVIVTDKGMERNAEGMVVSMEATGSKKHDGKGSRDQKGNEEPNGWAKISKDADTAFEEAQIFTVVETMPSFPGGEEERIKFLNDNIKYPQMARESGIQGSVFVTFVVERDGKITDARVLRGIGGGCDEEALRVIRKMPDWIPGKQRGKAVRVQFNFPIEFILN
ncbi:MAG: energy transducer TonB [Bacteroidales bacterium]